MMIHTPDGDYEVQGWYATVLENNPATVWSNGCGDVWELVAVARRIVD